MGKLERLSTKVVLFIIVSGAMNYYVLGRLFQIFGGAKDALFYAIWFFASVSYILCAELLRVFNNDAIKGIAGVFSVWMGASFIFLWTFALMDLVRAIFGLGLIPLAYFVIAVDVIIIGYSIFNATTFSVRTIRVESDKMHKSFKIIQLSDLHIGAAHKSDFVKRTVSRVNEMNPDFVVLTGDLIDGVHPYRGNEFEALNDLKMPIYFTMGNHERFIDISKVEMLLKKTPVKFLRNSSLTNDGLEIIGVDDASNMQEFKENFSKIHISKDKFTVLLYHRPSAFEEVAKHDVDLMLTGHTHGGQIFPLNIVLAIIDGPVRGIHSRNNSILYVSNGTGWWGPPMRLGSRNEITIIELISLNESMTPEVLVSEQSLKPNLQELIEKKEEKNLAPTHTKTGKRARIISLSRGKTAIKRSKKEDIMLAKLNNISASVSKRGKGETE